MKKNRIRMLSLFLAAAVFMTSGMTVFAAEAGAAGEPQAAEQPKEGGTALDTSSDKDTPKEQSGSGEQNTSSSPDTPADPNASVDPNASADKGAASDGNADGNPEKQENQAPIEGNIIDDSGEDKQASGTAQDPVEGNIVQGENSDDVKIKKNDKPYLALGADLSDAQRATVLSIMGIDPANLENYDVVYVTNAEEHQYLDSYISTSQIGSKSLSSVVIMKRGKGNGLNISTSNINYCTVGMYKNALTTAGIADADIIVAGPTGISGTAALVGIFKAYQEMTGETIEDNVVDAALHELVITGQLEASIEGLTDEEVEEFIAYIKSVIAENNLSDEESINKAIDDACEKYGVTLSDEERRQIIDLLLKITSLGIDLNGLVDYAASLYNSFKNGGGSGGVFSSIGNFFTNVFTTIADFFRNLFS